MTTQTNNVSPFVAARDWILAGTEALDGGTLSLAFAFSSLGDKPLAAPYMDGKVRRFVHFTFLEFAAGTGDVAPENKSKRGAAMNYLVGTVLEYSGPKENALKTAINKATGLAVLNHRNPDLKLSLKVKGTGKDKKTVLCGVPALIAFGLADETKATETLNKKLASAGRVALAFSDKAASGYSDQQVLNKLAVIPVDCDGGAFLGDVTTPMTTKALARIKEYGITQGWIALPESRNRDRDDEGNKALLKAIETVRDALASWASDECESAFAPTAQTDTAMEILATMLNTYGTSKE